MSKFTKQDFNKIIDYLEYKISKVQEDRMTQITASECMLQDRMFLYQLQGWHTLMADVRRDFCYGVFTGDENIE